MSCCSFCPHCRASPGNSLSRFSLPRSLGQPRLTTSFRRCCSAVLAPCPATTAVAITTHHRRRRLLPSQRPQTHCSGSEINCGKVPTRVRKRQSSRSNPAILSFIYYNFTSCLAYPRLFYLSTLSFTTHFFKQSDFHSLTIFQYTHCTIDQTSTLFSAKILKILILSSILFYLLHQTVLLQ